MLKKSVKRIIKTAIALLVAIVAFYVLVQIKAQAMLLLLNVLIILILVPLFITVCFAWLYSLPNISWLKKLQLPLGLISAIILLIISYHTAVYWLNQQLSTRNYASVYHGCYKVWATRGLVLNRPVDDSNAGNTIPTISLAFEKGARGVEIDVYYDHDLQQYVVSHNIPYMRHNGELLSLKELWKGVSVNGYYWLDFKNLRHISDSDVIAAAEKLQTISDALGMDKQRIYVEGGSPFNLGVFRDTGFKTIFDIQPLEDAHFMAPFVLNIYKLTFYLGGFSVIGMDYKTDDGVVYGSHTKEILGSIPLFIYHIPDKVPLLRKLSTLPQIRVLLDHDHGANHYNLTTCLQPE